MAPASGVYEQLNHMNMWDSNISPNTNLPSISQVDMTRQANKDMLQIKVSESELRVSVNSNLIHYYELFEIKANAVKSDVFYFMHGLWRTPIERFFQWLGGPRPSELLCMLMPNFGSLTDAQFKSLETLKHSCRQTEDALSTGMQKLQQILAHITGFESYNAQMTLAMERLEEIENFLNQADHLRQQVLQHVSRILTTHQAARGLLALGEYFQRLRALSSLCSSRSHAPEARANFAMVNVGSIVVWPKCKAQHKN